MTVELLAQQGAFTVFASVYCCAIPLGLALVLGVVYFAVRSFANRNHR
jgi:hypothetical protein